MAHENERTMHAGTIPKGGGLPLLAAAAFAILLTVSPQSWPPVSVAAGAGILTALSFADDIGHLPAAIRLPVHLAVAALAVFSLPDDARVFQGFLPYAIDRALAVVALAWMINLYNFMDGINGIAGAETIAICAGYLAVQWSVGQVLGYAPLAAALAGAAGGFLIWNARRAPLLFLGDSGSVPLGFLTGVLMLDLAVSGYAAAAVILPAYFFFDATVTLIKRLVRGEKVWHAHRSHTYQRAAAAFGAHLPVVHRISLANAGLIGAACLSVASPLAGLSVAAAILAALIFNLETIAGSRSSGSGPSQR